MIAKSASVLAATVLLAMGPAVDAQAPPKPPKVASLGECRLAAGPVIPNCRVAYREFGRANAARTNTVLIPTWLLGRSDDLRPLLGADGLVDTTRHHVLV